MIPSHPETFRNELRTISCFVRVHGSLTREPEILIKIIDSNVNLNDKQTTEVIA